MGNSIYLSYKRLRKMGACKEALQDFRECFGYQKVRVSYTNAIKFADFLRYKYRRGVLSFKDKYWWWIFRDYMIWLIDGTNELIHWKDCNDKDYDMITDAINGTEDMTHTLAAVVSFIITGDVK